MQDVLNVSPFLAKTFGSGMSLFSDMFSGIGSDVFGDMSNETFALRGWNWTAIHTKAMQFSLAEMDVFVSPSLKSEIVKIYGDDEKSTNGSVQSAQTENIPDGYEISPSRYRIRTLMSNPNRWMSEHIFKYMLGQHLEVFGVSYILVVPSNSGIPTEMFIVPKTLIQFRSGAVDGADGWYVGTLARFGRRNVDPDNVRTYRDMLQLLSNRTYPASWVIEVGIPHPFWMDDFTSPSDAMSDTIQTDYDLHASRRSVLMNQVTSGPELTTAPGVVLDPNQKEAYLAEIQAKATGPENAGRPFWTPDGVMLKNNQYSAREMEYAKSIAEMRDSILGQRGVSPSMVGLGDASNYASIVAQSRILARYWSQPEMNMVAGQISSGLRAFYQAPFNQFIVRLTAGTIDDPQLKEQQITNDLASLAIKKSEYRKIRQLDPFGDERDEEIAGAPAKPPGGEMPGAPGMPGMPGMPDAPIGDGGGVEDGTAADAASQTGTASVKAEYGEMSRLQFKRNSKSILDILQRVSDGELKPGVARELLNTIGIDPDRADRLIREAKSQETADVEEGKGVSSLIAKSARVGKPKKVAEPWIGIHLPKKLSEHILEWQDVIRQTGNVVDIPHIPHITLLYPVTEVKESVRVFRECVKASKPLRIFCGRVRVWEQETKDCLVVEVSCSELMDLQRHLKSSVPNGSDYRTFKPHITLAYVEKGTYDNFAGMVLGGVTGEAVTVKSVRFEHAGKTIAVQEIPEFVPGVSVFEPSKAS